MIGAINTNGDEPATQELVLIDQICDRYEKALKAGNRPRLGDMLANVPERARAVLLGEILLLEMCHGQPANALVRNLKSDHPELEQELDAALALVEHRIPTSIALEATTHVSDVVLVTESMPSPSRTIELTCPQCGRTVPVRIDAKQTEVMCQACGSEFSLTDDLADTAGVAALGKIDRFRLMSRLGVGGCGTVWKAYDTKLGRTVAIKIPRSGRVDREEDERFLREARTVAQLVHPNIVSVHEVGRDGELNYIVSDFVRGVPLSEWLTEKRLSAREAAELVVKVADALHYAHEQGIIHRDIKPSNIMMDADGEPHVTDFGLAKWISADFSIAVDSQVLGTPAYMSPEQARGEAHRSDRRTDVYALGVVLFQLLTMELPFRGNQEMLLHQIKYDAPPRMHKFDKNVPKDLETICLKCLEKPVANRYESARALADDLRRYLRGESVKARPVSPLVCGVRWCRRKPAAAAALGLLIVIAVAGPVIAAYQAELRTKEQRSRKDAQAMAQELVGLRAGSGTGTPAVQPIQFSLPLVTDRLAAAALDNGLALQRDVERSAPDDEAMARLQLAVGVLAAREGRTEAAISNLRHAGRTLERLRETAVHEPRYTVALAFCLEFLGQLYAARGVSADALHYQELAVGEWRRLVAEQPDVAAYRKALAESLLRLSLSQSLAGHGEIALENVRQSKTLVDQLVNTWTDDPERLYRLACELSACPPVLAEVRQEPGGSE